MAGGFGGNYGRMMRAQERAANVWRDRADERRERRTPSDWEASLLDAPSARCKTCGASEQDRPLMLVEGGHACALCLAPQPIPRRRLGVAWARSLAVLGWSVLVFLGVALCVALPNHAVGPVLTFFGSFPVFVAACIALWTAASLVIDLVAASRWEEDPLARRAERGRIWMASGVVGTSGLAGLAWLFCLWIVVVPLLLS